jgi:arylsulfatase A-like enzyme
MLSLLLMANASLFGSITGMQRLFLAFMAFASTLMGTESRPNVVFLVTDDQFKTMMNFYPEGKGKNLTPHTDKLSSEGIVMDRQYVTSPVCTPSRYSALTGLFPSRSQSPKFARSTKQAKGQTVVQWNAFITGEKSLAARFRDAGYFTGMVGKNHAFEAEDWEMPKWESDPKHAEVKALLERNRVAHAAAAKAVGFDFTASLYYNNPMENGVKALAAHNLDWIAKGALDFIDAAGERPFFLYLATTIPHGPQEPAKSWQADRRITADGLLDEPLKVLPAANTYAKRLQAAKIKSPQKENILWLDDMVGAVMTKLEQAGKLDNTILLYFNDHGQKSKGTLYEGGVHGESFLWRRGGFPAGHRSAVPVSNVDFAPTLLDLAGVSYDAADFDGKSFAPVLKGEVKERSEPLFFELGYVRGVIKDGWKYIALRYPENAKSMTREQRQHALDEFNEEQKRKGRPIHNKDPMANFSHVMLIPGGGDAEHESMGQYPAFYDADQLYDLSTDPGEQVNLATRHPEKLADLKSLLQAHLAKMPGTFAELKP